MFNEQRTAPRKVLKTRAIVTYDGAAPLHARTIDVGGNGVCLTYAQPLPAGLECELSFDMFLDGKVHTVRARSKTLYCIFSNGEYKIGFRFLSLDLAAMTLLARYMR